METHTIVHLHINVVLSTYEMCLKLDLSGSHRVSLHDQSGQKQDIEDYVRSVFYSDSQQIMKRWKIEDKELVIKRFRWVFCKLETLQVHWSPPVSAEWPM